MWHFPKAQLLFSLVAPLVLSGCGGPATGHVQGRVLLGEQAVVNGMVAFKAPDGRVASANINAEGRYSVPNAPVGECEITVQTFPPSPAVLPPDAKPGTKLPPYARHVKISPTYADFAASGIRYTVQPGSQDHDIQLVKKGDE